MFIVTDLVTLKQEISLFVSILVFKSIEISYSAELSMEKVL